MLIFASVETRFNANLFLGLFSLFNFVFKLVMIPSQDPILQNLFFFCNSTMISLCVCDTCKYFLYYCTDNLAIQVLFSIILQSFKFYRIDTWKHVRNVQKQQHQQQKFAFQRNQRFHPFNRIRQVGVSLFNSETIYLF